MNKLYFTVLNRDKLPDDYYRASYGEAAIVTRLGHINLIHLDFPSAEVVQQRIAETLCEQSAPRCDCPVCRQYKNHPLDIVYLRQGFAWPGFQN